jgi:hypothetical protein
MATKRPLGEGNGHSNGLIDIVHLSEGCSVFIANPQQPPLPDVPRFPAAGGGIHCPSRASR